MPCSLAVENGVLTAMGRPNDALGRQGRIRVMIGLVVFAILVGTAWAMIGAWPVLPFAGLEALCLAGAWMLISWHADDYEYVVIGEGRVAIDVRRGRRIERHAFQIPWTRVVLEQEEAGRCRVSLLSAGRGVEVGVWLPPDRRSEFADVLREHLRASGSPAC
jgi:uncharacterized membrane protein